MCPARVNKALHNLTAISGQPIKTKKRETACQFFCSKLTSSSWKCGTNIKFLFI